MSSFWIICWSLLYLLLLFVIADRAERRSSHKRSWVNNPYVYALSLAVYCTAWTFYGSVGRAAESGPDFLSVYIGPTLVIPLWWIIFRKVIRICKVQRITSIADFISARYGKSRALGVIVTVVCLLGIIPYISIQLKAITSSFLILSGNDTSPNQSFLSDQSFYIALMLIVFAILFGTRKLEANERHEGLVAAIAFESLVKLFAFLAVGVFITFGIFNGFDDIAARAVKVPELRKLFTLPENQTGNWFWHCFLAAIAILFLPRQFQVTVVENIDENHLKKAQWLFPLYLLIINIFVLPIALSGKLLFADEAIKSDTYLLAIPLHFKQQGLAFLTYLGGFSAATSMIIVECTALTVMFSNNLLMPFLVSRRGWQERMGSSIGSFVITARRLFIAVIILLAYAYYKNVSDKYSLVSVGMVSFAAVAQFAPAALGGICWKRANLTGAMSGILAGTTVWFYTLIIPSMASNGLISSDFLAHGPAHIHWLRPEAFLGLEGMDSLSHGVFWSLLFNVSFYVLGALNFSQSAVEHNQAALFVDIFRYDTSYERSVAWRGKALVTDITNLLSKFFGEMRAQRAITLYVKRNKLALSAKYADPQLVNYAEKMLSGAIGAASARVVVASVAKEEPVTVDEVIDILKTSQELRLVNEELTRKSRELEQLTGQLKEANERLQQADREKDDFLSTVTHEIRTPMTSIRALSEIVLDNPDMDEEQQKHFLSTIIKESDRLTRLINQVLDLERFETGKYQLTKETFHPETLIEESINSINALATEKNIVIQTSYAGKLPTINGDFDRLMQVLINLLSNAIKFCPAQNGLIEIRAMADGNYLSISVKDNGPGISAEHIALIFDKFYQGNAPLARKPKGSGLGLAISKKIIELHQGSIHVQSTVEEGALFTFEIPV
ncbi:histidine kinase [Runella sp. CRIBMP]|uniref:sodium:solute symporter family transporter n=1 Tax=Runella sp. CRIBMP TaxID=2683261 RepID=UPI001412DDF3|nr:ATP-binding protein [Runella sp. CRIBMP]NBB18362.1 histidine kinase [Runella sp. CRIBMP]